MILTSNGLSRWSPFDHEIQNRQPDENSVTPRVDALTVMRGLRGTDPLPLVAMPTVKRKIPPRELAGKALCRRYVWSQCAVLVVQSNGYTYTG